MKLTKANRFSHPQKKVNKGKRKEFMKPELELPRKHLRRNVLGLASLAVLYPLIHKDSEDETRAFKQLSQIKADTFSHNADTLAEINGAVGGGVELDVSQLKTGELVVSHTLPDIITAPQEFVSAQDPRVFAHAIRAKGARVHFDVKNVEYAPSFAAFLREQQKIKPVSVSSLDHTFLWGLQKEGFDGQILFTLTENKGRHGDPVKDFIEKYLSQNPHEGKLGVSINHKILTPHTGKQLTDLDLYILAWTPNSAHEVRDAIRFGANGITSDRPRLLRQIGRNFENV